MRRLLDFDPVTGLKSYHEFKDGRNVIEYEQDVSKILDYNKHIQNENQSEYRRNRDMWHIASIPQVVILKWLHEDGIDVFNDDHLDDVVKKLNDPEWAHLRTIRGNM
tara:strand:- start:757 stop:1077 length:321 start_codon:yes stop_codon:yes gene_type:complete